MNFGALLARRYPSQFPGWHRRVYRVTRGLIGHRWTGYTCLLLSTTGRKTGQVRDTVLTYAATGEALFVAGSNGGSDVPPAWLLNIEADPRVSIRVGRRSWETAGELIRPGDERFDLGWSKLNEIRSGRYDQYQQSTDRPIPLVRFAVRGAAVSRKMP